MRILNCGGVPVLEPDGSEAAALDLNLAGGVSTPSAGIAPSRGRDKRLGLSQPAMSQP